MCQLMGMNCGAPTDCSFSFRGFCQRGGGTDIHSHGFGLSIYEGRGVRSFLDTLPAVQSPVAKLVQQYPIRTYNMLAHVRYATSGGVSLENVHPFTRELWGIQWTFAHNGQVPKFEFPTQDQSRTDEHSSQRQCTPLLGKPRKLYQQYQQEQEYDSDSRNILNGDTSNNSNPFGRMMMMQHWYHPVGDTDSEAVFCAILNALKAEFSSLPTLPMLHEFLLQLCEEIIHGDEDMAIFNFLLGCGQYTLFAYSWPGRRPGSDVWNGLYYIVRSPPFSTAQLVDIDCSIDFAQVNKHPNDRVAVIATNPLTNEDGWIEFERGQLLMFDKGLPYRTPTCCEMVEQEGRGLVSKYFQKTKTVCTNYDREHSVDENFLLLATSPTDVTSMPSSHMPLHHDE